MKKTRFFSLQEIRTVHCTEENSAGVKAYTDKDKLKNALVDIGIDFKESSKEITIEAKEYIDTLVFRFDENDNFLSTN